MSVSVVFTRLNALADLRGANLTGAILDGAVLTGARADSATIWPADLDAERRRELGIIDVL
jgi:uncharacterized protein YjbI with pentapeptide repeats